MTKALLYTLERPAPHTLTAAAGSQRPRRALRDSFARPAAPTRQLEDVLGAAARGGGSDLHVLPLLQLGHEAPRRPRELELEVSEKWKLGSGGVLSCLVGDHDRLEIPLKTPSEERPRGACLGVSEGPRSLRGCAERGWLGGTGLQRVGPGTL